MCVCVCVCAYVRFPACVYDNMCFFIIRSFDNNRYRTITSLIYALLHLYLNSVNVIYHFECALM